MPPEDRILVSVVITAYNAEEYIAETLTSVCAQTYTPLEVILVDDGSSDDTAEIVKGRFPAVCYVHQPNSGQPSARNTGIRKALGKYVAFVDSDDLWLPQKIAKQVEKLERSALAWCYCDSLYFSGTFDNIMYRYSSLMRPHSGHAISQLLLGNFISSPTPIIRRDALFDVGLWDETRTMVEDWNMWLKVAARFPVGYVDEPLAAYRRHAGNMSGGWQLESLLRANLEVLDNALGYLPDSAPRLAARARANIYFKIGLAYLNTGKQRDGQRMISKALRNNPFQLRLYAYMLASLLPTRLVLSLNRWRHAYCRMAKPLSR